MVLDYDPLPSSRQPGTEARQPSPSLEMPGRLLTLPPELRNMIYGHVMPTETQEVRFSTSVFPPVPAILQVSRQVRAEASGLYYRHCSFDLVLHHRSIWQLRAWTSTLPQKSVRRLCLNGNVNLRLVYDKYHKDFEHFKHLLCFYSSGPNKVQNETGKHGMWFSSAESAGHLPLELMADIGWLRARKGFTRLAETALVPAHRNATRASHAYRRHVARMNEGRDLLRAAKDQIRGDVKRVMQDRWSEGAEKVSRISF